jgi:hypothetical protein
MASQFERFRFPQVKLLKYLNQFCEQSSLSAQKPTASEFSGAACEIGSSQITNSGDNIPLTVIPSISIALKRTLPLNLTVADTNACDTKYTIESELKFWRAKKSWCYDFGIIKYARNSTAFFKQSGLRWRNAVHTIPHLNPLPLRKGEATFLPRFAPYLKNRAAAFSGPRCIPLL